MGSIAKKSLQDEGDLIDFWRLDKGVGMIEKLCRKSYLNSCATCAKPIAKHVLFLC